MTGGNTSHYTTADLRIEVSCDVHIAWSSLCGRRGGGPCEDSGPPAIASSHPSRDTGAVANGEGRCVCRPPGCLRPCPAGSGAFARLPCARAWSKQTASAGNRTRVTSMATMYSTTRPLMHSASALLECPPLLCSGDIDCPSRAGRLAPPRRGCRPPTIACRAERLPAHPDTHQPVRPSWHAWVFRAQS